MKIQTTEYGKTAYIVITTEHKKTTIRIDKEKEIVEMLKNEHKPQTKRR